MKRETTTTTCATSHVLCGDTLRPFVRLRMPLTQARRYMRDRCACPHTPQAMVFSGSAQSEECQAVRQCVCRRAYPTPSEKEEEVAKDARNPVLCMYMSIISRTPAIVSTAALIQHYISTERCRRRTCDILSTWCGSTNCTVCLCALKTFTRTTQPCIAGLELSTRL